MSKVQQFSEIQHCILYFPCLQSSLLIFVSEMPQFETALLFFLQPRTALTDIDIILLGARLWLKYSSSGWAADECRQRSWRCWNTSHDRELGWRVGAGRERCQLFAGCCLWRQQALGGRLMSISAAN